MPDEDGEYHYTCTECDNEFWSGIWREAADCPECSTGKIISDEARNR